MSEVSSVSEMSSVLVCQESSMTIESAVIEKVDFCLVLHDFGLVWSMCLVCVCGVQ